VACAYWLLWFRVLCCPAVACVHWLLWFRVLCCPAVACVHWCCGSVCYVVQLWPVCTGVVVPCVMLSQYMTNNINISAFK
jgi:hypothetical protein